MSGVVAPTAVSAPAPWNPGARSIAEAVADFVLEREAPHATPAMLSRAGVHVLDLLAVGLAGARAASSQPAVRVARAAGNKPEATVFEAGLVASAADAALANGTCVRALEFDDDHRTATLHPGAVVVPAAPAAAEAAGPPGETFLRAVLLGYEVMCRAGEALLGRQYYRGFHPTGTCGVFGAAVAAGVRLGLDREALVWALGIAGTAGEQRHVNALLTTTFADGVRKAVGGGVDSLLVRGGRIAALGPASEVGAGEVEAVVDCRGTTVVPGLIDSHCHVVLGDYTPRQKTVDFLESYVHGGITSVVSAGEGVHAPGRPHDPVASRALAIAAAKCFPYVRPTGMKVHAGSVVLEPGLTDGDFEEMAGHGAQCPTAAAPRSPGRAR